MRQNVMRFSGWVVLLLVLALLAVSGCTRAKTSEGPPAPTTGGEVLATTQAGGEPTATLSGDEATEATRSALAVEATQTAQPQPTAVPPTETPVPSPTKAPEPTAQPETTAEPEPTAEAEPTATTEPEPTEAPTGEATTHAVQAGENLFRIALKYNLTYEQLAAYNGITNPNLIYVGQVLKIPPVGAPVQPPADGEEGVTYHVVQPGENLFRIALKYNMLFSRLAAANDLAYPYTIYPGQKLIIP